MKDVEKEKKGWITRAVGGESRRGWWCSRFWVFLIFAGVQLLLFVGILLLLFYRSAIGVVLQTAVAVLSLLTALQILGRDGTPSMKTAWLLTVAFVPAIGAPAYWLYGNGRCTRDMRERLEKSKAEILSWREKNPPIACGGQADSLSAYLEKFAHSPAYTDGDVAYYADGEKLFEEMLSAAKSAKTFIFVEYFIIQRGKMWDSLLKVLLEKAAQGVKVRIIYDDFGCIKTLPKGYDEYLESLHENVRCMAFNRVTPALAWRLNYRDHRKMLVVDGKTAFTGGINLADEYIGEKQRFGHWKDSGVRVSGGAARTFTEDFLWLWNAFYARAEDVGFYLESRAAGMRRKEFLAQPYADSPLDEIRIGGGAYAGLIQRAKRYVWIFTPYLVLDEYLRGALCHASMRGVDVRIVTPGIPDKKTVYRLTRANYAVLLRAGVKIYEYTSGFLHAKSVVCDDECAIVGTVNFDYRSLYHHFENAVYFTEQSGVEDLKRDCLQTFALSKPCTAEDAKRSFFGKLLDDVLKIFETLL